MKVNLDVVLKEIDGTDMRDEKGRPLTAKSVVVNLLMSIIPMEQPQPDGLEKAKRETLGLKLYAGGDQEIEVEEAATIKKLVGLIQPPLIVGPIFRLLK